MKKDLKLTHKIKTYQIKLQNSNREKIQQSKKNNYNCFYNN
jgi:hypothetical protein